MSAYDQAHWAVLNMRDEMSNRLERDPCCRDEGVDYDRITRLRTRLHAHLAFVAAAMEAVEQVDSSDRPDGYELEALEALFAEHPMEAER